MDQKVQPAQLNELVRFAVAIIVAGGRNYNNYGEFCILLEGYLKEEFPKAFEEKDICFVTGKANRGPDDMIIRWCIEHGYAWVEMPADWELYGKRAGFIRNDEMSECGAKNLIVMWDGKSKGSKHMYETGIKKGLNVMSIIVTPDEESGICLETERRPRNSAWQ